MAAASAVLTVAAALHRLSGFLIAHHASDNQAHNAHNYNTGYNCSHTSTSVSIFNSFTFLLFGYYLAPTFFFTDICSVSLSLYGLNSK